MPRLPPFHCARGLNRVEAARYVGVSPTTFDKLVDTGQMPRPKQVGARRIYDRHQLDWCFDLLDSDVAVEPNDFD